MSDSDVILRGCSGGHHFEVTRGELRQWSRNRPLEEMGEVGRMFRALRDEQILKRLREYGGGSD